MATDVPALMEDVVCGMNYALCLKTMPRQPSTIHPNDYEHLRHCYAFYGNCSKTTLHVVVMPRVNRLHLYRRCLHALYQWRQYLPVLSRFIHEHAIERGSNAANMRAKHRTEVRSTSWVTSTLTLQHLVRPDKTVSQLCDPAHNFRLITRRHHSFHGLFGDLDRTLKQLL